VIFVDTGFFFALFAAEEKDRHARAHELLKTLSGRKLSDVLITTDQVRSVSSEMRHGGLGI
jgi:predicted nucleic acid-binding protein